MSDTVNSSDPAGRHDWFSPAYVDRWIEGDRSGRPRQHQLTRIVEGVDLPVSSVHRVLDVGAGFGALTRCVLERFTEATVVMQDFSRPMLDRAPAHLGPYRGRVEVAVADLRDPEWSEVAPGPFDAVVSSLAIHNVREPDLIARIYVDLRAVLRQGGALADFDLLEGHTAAERTGWLAQAGFVDIAVDRGLWGAGGGLFTARRP